jgi:hypothetical protein
MESKNDQSEFEPGEWVAHRMRRGFFRLLKRKTEFSWLAEDEVNNEGYILTHSNLIKITSLMKELI